MHVLIIKISIEVHLCVNISVELNVINTINCDYINLYSENAIW